MAELELAISFEFDTKAKNKDSTPYYSRPRFHQVTRKRYYVTEFRTVSKGLANRRIG